MHTYLILTIDVNTIVYLAHIVIGEDSLITSIGSVMSSTVIEGAASGKGQTSLQTLLLDQLAVSFLNHVANLNHCHPRLHVPLEVLPRLMGERKSQCRRRGSDIGITTALAKGLITSSNINMIDLCLLTVR